MSFGAIITTGEDHQRMPSAIMSQVTECRVEQDMSKLTEFAIRFQDDICDGDPVIAGRPELAPNAMIGVFVKRNSVLHCLVSGRITQKRTSSMAGGAGSWVEVKGQDDLVRMDRVGVQASWNGKASDAAKSLFELFGFEDNCQETLKDYDDAQNTLNQRGTDLAFIKDIARKNNMELWLSYEASEDAAAQAALALDPNADPGPVTLNVKANLFTSPEQPTVTSTTALPSPSPPVLAPDQGLVIPVQPPAGECAKLTKFDVKIDYEKPNASIGFAQDVETGEENQQQQQSEAALLDPGAEVFSDIDGVQREEIAPPATDPDEAFLAQQALLTEAAWFVEVECSSTLDLLDFAVMPHQIVEVANAGAQLSGPYQVMTATHVINPSDHFIDFKLRANGLRPPTEAAA